MSFLQSIWPEKTTTIVGFASTAIALYGYDQGMMSLINTNHDYLATMGITNDSPWVGIIVSVYYIGCAVGAVAISAFSDHYGRRPGLFLCLALSSLGNLIMFISGLGYSRGALIVMFIGRIVMGFGVGGIDSIVPVYSSELNEDDSRGKALAQEFQMNILGLNIAFAINLAVTIELGKENQWAWRIPIIAMQVFPIVLMSIIQVLPESPRFLILHDREEDAHEALKVVYPDEKQSKEKFNNLKNSHEEETQSGSHGVSYADMFTPGKEHFHPTMITVMGQVNQALTGYGAVSVYGPQIFQLLRFGSQTSAYLTQGNYISYLLLMTFAWLLIDALGRRTLMVSNSIGLTLNFALLAVFGGLAQHCEELDISKTAIGVLGSVALFVATGNFGIGWLATVWLIPTEIYPTIARAKGTAVSVIIWGIANFAITLLTPIMFNNLSFYIFVVFTVTNLFAGVWTYFYLPETGGRPFEENQRFFQDAQEAGTWRVHKVNQGEFLFFPAQSARAAGYGEDGDGSETAERAPLLDRIRDQVG